MASTSASASSGAAATRDSTPPWSTSRQDAGAEGPVTRSVDAGEQVGSSSSTSSSGSASPSRTYAKPVSQSGNAPYYPASDAQTYRDLLIFEERLKQNAARLVKRKKKYQTFLVLLCIAIAFSAYYVFMRPAKWQPLHYLNVSNLLITSTMLLLFFASGMYAERITAANKFVPQANRSLRAYNMYLNTRTSSRRSFFTFFTSSPPSPTGSRSPVYLPGEKETTSSTTRLVRTPSPGGGPGVARRMAIPTIPPTSNPRGELIFGSKVSQQFREGYERYRSAFERRRQEKLEERRLQGWRGWRIFGGRKADVSRVDPERGTEKSRTATPPMRNSGHLGPRHAQLSSSASVRHSPRAQRKKLQDDRTGEIGPASDTSSPASSRRSSPTSSPRTKPRARLASLDSNNLDARGDTEDTASKEKEPTDDTTASQGLSEAGATIVSDVAQSDKAAASIAPEPDPSSVASHADDRQDAAATLREPAAM